jgi:hypothetical protein
MNDHFAAAGLGRLILAGPGLVRSAARPHRPTRGAAVLRDYCRVGREAVPRAILAGSGPNLA